MPLLRLSWSGYKTCRWSPRTSIGNKCRCWRVLRSRTGTVPIGIIKAHQIWCRLSMIEDLARISLRVATCSRQGTPSEIVRNLLDRLKLLRISRDLRFSVVDPWKSGKVIFLRTVCSSTLAKHRPLVRVLHNRQKGILLPYTEVV